MKSGFGERDRPANLRELLRFGEKYLAERGVADASVDAWLLLEHVTGLSRAQYLARSAEALEAFCGTLQPEEKPDFRRAKRSAGRYSGYSAEESFTGEALAEEPGAETDSAGKSGKRLVTAVTAEALLREYRDLLERRGAHIPLQHLTGEQEFMGLPFLVNEHVLIPRQDTETLVEEALKRLRPGMQVLDLCTGSGCIAVSLAKLGPEYLARKTEKGSRGVGDSKAAGETGKNAGQEIYVDASDISPEALAVARRNARRFGARVRFFEGDLFSGINGVSDVSRTDEFAGRIEAAGTDVFAGRIEAAEEDEFAGRIGAAGTDVFAGKIGTAGAIRTGDNVVRYDMIVSNPPYIRTSVIAELAEEVRLHEPVLALDGSEDGLHFYREIVRQSPAHLADDGWLLFEIGYDQAEAVSALMTEAGFAEIEVIRDLAGNDRVVLGRRKLQI